MATPKTTTTAHDYYQASQSQQPPATFLPNESGASLAVAQAAAERQVKAANANVAKPAKRS